MSVTKSKWTVSAAFVLLVATTSMSTTAADHVNPNQAEIDQLTDQKALIDAQVGLATSQASQAKGQFPSFGDNFGKTGALTVETSERDKFHVTARSAESFVSAAKQIATILSAEIATPVVLLTDADRNAIPIYWSERIRLNRLLTDTKPFSDVTSPTPEAAGAAISGVGALLSQVAEFSQLFRTNKSVAFDDSLLPDEFLLDLVAAEPTTMGKLLYPAGALDSLLEGASSTQFGKDIATLFSRRLKLTAALAVKDKKEIASAILAEMDTLATRLVATDAATKVPELLTVMRGELASDYLKVADGRTFSLKVAAKGGASLKTSSIWHSDRLYASGGIVVTYRLSSGGQLATVKKAGVIVSETKFMRIPLD